jgi:hypothetical protein
MKSALRSGRPLPSGDQKRAEDTMVLDGFEQGREPVDFGSVPARPRPIRRPPLSDERARRTTPNPPPCALGYRPACAVEIDL